MSVPEELKALWRLSAGESGVDGSDLMLGGWALMPLDAVIEVYQMQMRFQEENGADDTEDTLVLWKPSWIPFCSFNPDDTVHALSLNGETGEVCQWTDLRLVRRMGTALPHRSLVAAVDHARRASRTPPSAGRTIPPSWCYGTPGIARALQLAALATGNRTRRATAERALIGCLADERQVRQIIDTSLCHGWPVSYTRSGTPPATPPTLNSSPLPTCCAPC